MILADMPVDDFMVIVADYLQVMANNQFLFILIACLLAAVFGGLLALIFIRKI